MIERLLILIFWTAPLSLLIHEWGHVLPALWSRADQSEISIGSGKRLFSITMKRVRIHFHMVFFHGAHSLNERRIQFSKVEKAWVSLGGPLLNGVVAVTLLLGPWDQLSSHVQWFGWFNAYLAIVNCVPFHLKGRKSDGYRFFEAFLS